MRKLLLMGAAVGTLLLSCGKSTDNGGDEGPQGFDKTAMLQYYADSLIIPGYAALQQAVTGLQTAADAFVASPSTGTQATLKTAYTATHLQYAKVAPFQFGPAETTLLDIFLNFSGGLDYNFNTSGDLTGFSIDSVSIEQRIAAGSYNLADLNRTSFYSQGFPALNYLCFGPNAIEKFSANTANRKKYISDVVSRIKTLTDKVKNDWGSHRGNFVTNTKSDVGSPIGNMVNQLAYQLDMLKGPRIGWPFGKQSNGIVFASKCEAYFAGISLELAIANITNLKKIYTANNSGKGFSDYLVSLGKQALSNDVSAQFDLTIGKLQAIPAPLHTALTTQPALVEAAYKETQKLLTLLKTDVASATGVQITFMDNDGD